jgi:ketosteroid isomerase-like protein
MKSMRAALGVSLLAFASVASVASGVAAQSPQSPWMNLPPLPVREKGFPARLAPVVEAEHAFAQSSIDHGMKDAFLSFAAPDGVVFRRGPVNAIELWRSRNPAPAGLLTWWPVYADVSSAGDLGWTTGPYEFREKPADEKPAGTGHFFTVWRRQPDGSWKFVLDLGIEHPAPAAPETALQYPARLRNSKTASGAADTSAAQRSLADAERSLAEDFLSKGMTTALLARADETLRLYRQDAFPVVGREAVRKTLMSMTEFIKWETLKTDVASSGDLGYAYGTYELRAKPTDEKPSERGNYARVWKRQGKGPWRVVFNVATPVR